MGGSEFSRLALGLTRERPYDSLLGLGMTGPYDSLLRLALDVRPYDLGLLAQNLLAQPKSLFLHWHRCVGNEWGNLSRLYLDDAHFDGREGVYVIWSPTTRRAIRVGQGNIRERLKAHRGDLEIASWCPVGGELFVTWADAEARYRDGVERFLGEKLGPAVGARFPYATPIAVNLPA